MKHEPNKKEHSVESANVYIMNRTTKSDGEIKLRFRLRDGRDVDLYHKSSICAELDKLSKFDASGNKKSGVKIFDTELKQSIDNEISIIKQAYGQMIDGNMVFTSEILESEIYRIKHPEPTESRELNFFDSYVDFVDRLKNVVTDARIKHYRVLESILDRYLKITNQTDISLTDVSHNFLMDFRDFIINECDFVEDYPNIYRNPDKNKLYRFAPTQPRNINTLSMKMKMLHAFFTAMENDDRIIKSPFRSLGKVRRGKLLKEWNNEPYYLYQTELAHIINTDVPQSLQETKDAFILQCAFGCRIGDFTSLTMDNLSVNKDGIPYIHYLPQKTKNTQGNNVEIKTPVMMYAFNIIKQYQFKFNILKYAFGEKGYNHKIKRLLEYCGIDRKCTIFNNNTKENEYLPLYQIASSKLCRKTHIDIMNKVQVNKYVAGLHRLGSKAVDHYTHLELKDTFILMCLAFEQPQYKVDKQLNIISD